MEQFTNETAGQGVARLDGAIPDDYCAASSFESSSTDHLFESSIFPPLFYSLSLSKLIGARPTCGNSWDTLCLVCV